MPFVMPEFLQLLDELELLVDSGKGVPTATHMKIIDEEQFNVLTQRIRSELSEALKRAEPKSISSVVVSRLRREDTVLLVVDLQEKFLPVVHEFDRVQKNASLLLRVAKQLQMPIIFTEQYPEKLGRTRPELLEIAPEAPVIPKLLFSACTERTLQAIEQSGRKTVLVCGIEAHICMLQTTLDLRERGYHVFVPRDAISSRTPQNVEAGWQRMMQAGVLSTSAESATYELLVEAGTPDFKALLPFIK